MKDSKTREGVLRQISPDKIRRNPENPRIFFRSEEMGTLMASIKRYGIQVPITVYQQDEEYVLIDGERRWRCASKLNLSKIPAIVQPEPSGLENLLLMFNIHALREQWDYFTIARKLPDVIERFSDENGYFPNEIELSEITGLARGQIRRCRFLLDLPKKYQNVLADELQKPKHLQYLTEDFFIEMEKSLKTVSNKMPDVIYDKDDVRDVLISKFRGDVITNIIDFRKISKIATSPVSAGVDPSKARSALEAIFSDNSVSIDAVFSAQFEFFFDEKKILRSIESLSEYLEGICESPLDEAESQRDLVEALRRLRDLIDQVAGGSDVV